MGSDGRHPLRVWVSLTPACTVLSVMSLGLLCTVGSVGLQSRLGTLGPAVGTREEGVLRQSSYSVRLNIPHTPFVRALIPNLRHSSMRHAVASPARTRICIQSKLNQSGAQLICCQQSLVRDKMRPEPLGSKKEWSAVGAE